MRHGIYGTSDILGNCNVIEPHYGLKNSGIRHGNRDMGHSLASPDLCTLRGLTVVLTRSMLPGIELVTIPLATDVTYCG